MLTGEYRVALDEKSRLLVPTKVRTEIPGTSLVLTKGMDHCLWLFPPDQWAKIAKSILESTSMFNQQGRMIQRRIIAPAAELEVDKTGRITIPALLREHAGLKKDILVLGIRNYLEIWDEEAYLAYQNETEASFNDMADQMSILWPKE
ncbi:MAG: cell division/cell wall cluster transcriptional repressor MraZ [Spirochaetes bacterium GWB1_48_6]|nr:MAG: cell division/cell wall cluster transcriptional repressor MraZ [Spirochaetes bacterium GWB1_48_6]